MEFLPPVFEVPNEMRTADLYVRPLVAEDVDLDYDAIMSSQAMLRSWGWPFDFETYTKEADLDAIVKDRKIHVAHRAFCYAIMNAKDTYCFGSVYIQPLIEELLVALAEKDGAAERYGAEVSFWVREAMIDEGFDAAVLDEVVEWLKHDWPFDCVLFSATEANQRQIGLLESRGFPLVYEASNENVIAKLYRRGRQRFYRMSVAPGRGT